MHWWCFLAAFGTLDEMFEILTLRQTGKLTRLPVVLFNQAYWRSILNSSRWSRMA